MMFDLDCESAFGQSARIHFLSSLDNQGNGEKNINDSWHNVNFGNIAVSKGNDDHIGMGNINQPRLCLKREVEAPAETETPSRQEPWVAPTISGI